MNIGTALKNAREELELKQRKVVKEIKGLDDRMLSKIEQHNCLPIAEHLNRLSEIYRVPLDDLLKHICAEYGLRMPVKPRVSAGVPDVYKLDRRLPRAFASDLFEAVRAKGYSSIPAWVEAAAHELVNEYKSSNSERLSSSTR